MAELPRRRPAKPAGTPAPAVEGQGDQHAGGGGVSIDARPSPLAMLGRHPLLVLLAAVACGLAGYVASKAQEPQYEAVGRLFLVDPNTTLDLDFARTSYLDPRRNARNRAEIARSVPVLSQAARELGVSVESVRDRVDAVPSRESDIVTLTAVGDSPEEAARLLTLVQDAYRDITLSRERAPFQRAVTDLRELTLEVEQRLKSVRSRLEALPLSSSLQEERDLLRDQLRLLRNREASLRSNAAFLGTGVHLFERPTIPEAPISPRPLRTALVAGLFGALATVGLLWWREGRDPPVAGPDTVEEALAVPLVADLGSSLPWRSLRLRSRGDREEGYRRLSYSVDALAREGTRVIFVTAARAEDLQIAVALWTAGGLATAGYRSVLVDADRHRRRLSRHLGAFSAPGLTDIEHDDGDQVAARLVHRRVAGSPAIGFLPLGRRASRLRALEGTRIYRAALRALAGRCDVIVANGPALVSLAEANPGALPELKVLVVCGPKTPFGALAELRGRLDLLGLSAAGFVFERGGRIELALRRGLGRLASRRRASAFRRRPRTRTEDAGGSQGK